MTDLRIAPPHEQHLEQLIPVGLVRFSLWFLRTVCICLWRTEPLNLKEFTAAAAAHVFSSSRQKLQLFLMKTWSKCGNKAGPTSLLVSWKKKLLLCCSASWVNNALHGFFEAFAEEIKRKIPDCAPYPPRCVPQKNPGLSRKQQQTNQNGSYLIGPSPARETQRFNPNLSQPAVPRSQELQH